MTDLDRLLFTSIPLNMALGPALDTFGLSFGWQQLVFLILLLALNEAYRWNDA